MTVVVSDLVARFRADLGDVQRGAQQARQEMAGVAQEAKATGEQLDALSRKFAQSQGGAAAQWRQILETQRLGASQVDEMLGRGAQSAQRAASAAQQIAQPTQAAAKAASDLHEGFRLSESSMVRFGASLVGVGLGISLVAGAGRLLHDAIVGTLGAQLQYEQSLVRARGILGDNASAVVAMSRAQAATPGLLGSQQEFLAANLAFQPLVNRYGLTDQARFGVTSAAGRVAEVLGLTAEERANLQQRALTNVTSGGDALSYVTGTVLDPMTIARRLGGVSPEQLRALTAPQLVAAQAEMTAVDLNRVALQGAQGRPGLLAARTTAEQALLRAQTNLQNAIGGTGGASLVEPLGPELSGRFPGLPTENFPSTLAETAQNQVRQFQEELDKATKAIGSNQEEFEQHTANLRRMGVEYGGAAFRLLGFFGSPEDPLSIARGDVGAQAQAAVAARMRSAVPGIGTPNAEIAATSVQDAYQAAYQNYVARIAQGNTDNATREFLQGRATAEAGLTRDRSDRAQAAAEANTPAGRAIREAQLTAPVRQQIGEAQRTAQQLDMQAAQQQADLERITLTQRERGLRMLQETVELRKLDVQQQMTSVRLGQDVIRAQQAALPTIGIASAARYQQNLALAVSQQRVARLLQGRDISDLPTVDQLIQMNVQGQLAEAENAPALVRGARGVEVAGQAATAAGLAQQLTASQVQLAQMAVDLKNLDDLPQQTATELELLQTNRDQLSVQTELREYTKQLVWIMTNPGSSGGSAPPAPPDMPGARRGPF